MARGRPRAGGRAKKAKDANAPPDIYRQMLDEADRAAPSSRDAEGKTVKKRRVGGRIVVQTRQTPEADSVVAYEAGKEQSGGDESPPSPASLMSGPVLQTIDYDPEDSQEDEDDDVFEDVDIDGDDDGGTADALQGKDLGTETLNLVLGDAKPEKGPGRKRRAVTNISDKKLVVRTHKLHLLCLMSHLSLRNHWCNDAQAQRSLRKLLPRKIKEQFVDDEQESQYTRDLKLREGLQAAMEIFKDRFQKTARGLARPWWDAPENDAKPPSFDDLDLLVSVDDFRRAATRIEGSRDVGAQLFCAMLRSCGLEVRLVHSLQVLPINGATRPDEQVAPRPAQIIRYQDTRSGIANASSPSGYSYPHLLAPEEDISTEAGRAAGVRRKLAKLGGRSSLTATPAPQSPARTPAPSNPSQSWSRPAQVRLRESSCPVYWVEVFSPAYQKWIPADPLVTNSFSRPSALCPALKDSQNVLAYVIGIEEDGVARDVTRRYSTVYNAKTRKFRVDVMAGSEGSKWWRRVLRLYRRPIEDAGTTQDRDSIEDAEFKRREAREGMPKNVEDFKGHPVYVLERHLRRNEVIHPERQVGTTGGEKSTATKGKPVEIVYRRQDVHVVKSADAWYRLGREIKLGQQPLKRVPARRRATRAASLEDEDEGEGEEQGLYAFFQTELYQAPPVMLGRVPRNAYGNLDVYVPTMIPPGAVHILHDDTRYAAHLLKVDCADAVTGFEFKGRQGTAVVRGAVVAAEYKDAIIEILHGFESERAEAAAVEMTRACLRIWRRFLIGLRVKERVDGYAKDDESDEYDEGHSDDEEDVYEASDDGEEGGFAEESKKQTRSRSKSRIAITGNAKGNFTVIEGPKMEEFEPESENPIQPTQQETKTAMELGEAGPGGFLVDSDEDRSLFGDAEDPRDDGAGGGFLVEDAGSDAGLRENLSDSVERQGDVPASATGFEETSSHQNNQKPAPESKPPETQITPLLHQTAPERQFTRDKTKTNDNRDSNPKEKVPPSEESDRGSLLSEDPEDMDADPDWLG